MIKSRTLSGVRRAVQRQASLHSRHMIHPQGPSLLQRLRYAGIGADESTRLGLLRSDRPFHTANNWDFYIEYCLSEQETAPGVVNEPTIKLDSNGDPIEHFCWNPTDVTLLRELGSKKNWVVIYTVCGDAIAAEEGKIRDKMIYPLPLEPCIDEPVVTNI